MSDDAGKADRLSLHDLLLAFTALEDCTRATRPIPARHVRQRENRDLTFDMSGGAKGAKRPLERPLDGRVRCRCIRLGESDGCARGGDLLCSTGG